MTVDQRTSYLIKTTSIFYLTGIVMSYKLWLPLRQFPLLPIGQADKYLDSSAIPLALLLVVSLVISLFRPGRVVFFLVITSIGLLVLLDQVRLQPWVYMYTLFFVVFMILQNKPGTNSEEVVICLLKLVITGSYFWAGLHKLNPGFIETTYNPILEVLFGISNPDILSVMQPFGYALPILEILIAITLFFPGFCFVGILSATAMHVFILIYLSPLGIDHNWIVYPWNIAMIIFVWLLFYKSEKKLKISIFQDSKAITAGIVLTILVWLLPFLNFFGFWDHYLSFSLYSGKTSELVVFADKNVSVKFPEFLQAYISDKGNYDRLLINDWCMGELNVPIYPELRIYRRIAGKFCGYQQYGKLYIRAYQKPFSMKKYIAIKCPEN
ncbi:hypothetical protein [Reichenbachiella sp. MALMAid0571]|uniref:hypothetical protein n=1 Tax=Reichenbachiella sp. MALMAid0571 TaxID=3143939 RepID=UPI0032E0575F